MSHTQFVGTATLHVADEFNLEEYFEKLSFKCISENNFIVEDYGVEDDKVDLDFSDYVSQVDNKILIKCDTDTLENNYYNSQVWDWLIEQFLEVMTSSYMEIKSATIDSQSGVDHGTSYYLKDGRFIGSDDVHNVVEQYIKMSS